MNSRDEGDEGDLSWKAGRGAGVTDLLLVLGQLPSTSDDSGSVSVCLAFC